MAVRSGHVSLFFTNSGYSHGMVLHPAGFEQHLHAPSGTYPEVLATRVLIAAIRIQDSRRRIAAIRIQDYLLPGCVSPLFAPTVKSLYEWLPVAVNVHCCSRVAAVAHKGVCTQLVANSISSHPEVLAQS